MDEIIAELEDAENKLKAQIEKLYGKVETTDFADEYAELQDVLAKLKAFKASGPEAAPAA
jgi:hypothetical protein